MFPTAAKLLRADRILLDLKAPDKNAAILELADFVRHDEDILDFEPLCRELVARDELRSTAAGYGVAFPHARTNAVKEIIVAAGRSVAGVRFGDETVHFIFAIGTPREKANEYLVAVGTLARLVRPDATRAALAAVTTPEDFIKALDGVC